MVDPRLREALVGGATGAVTAITIGFVVQSGGRLSALLTSPELVGAALGACITILGALYVERHNRDRADRQRRRAALDIFEAIRDSLIKLSDAKGGEASRLLQQVRLGMRVLEAEQGNIALGLLGRAALLKLHDDWPAHLHGIEKAVSASVMYPNYALPEQTKANVTVLVGHLDNIILSLKAE